MQSTRPRKLRWFTAVSSCSVWHAVHVCTDHALPCVCPMQIVLGTEFDVDHVYLPKDRDAVYEDEVQALVGSLYEGINSTVFAYGASACLLPGVT